MDIGNADHTRSGLLTVACILLAAGLLTGILLNARPAQARRYVFRDSYPAADLLTYPGAATDVVVAPDGSLYVSDSAGNMVRKFSADGRLLLSWGGPGEGDGKFSLPIDVDLDADGNVYVADTYHNKIQKFTSTGVHLDSFGEWEILNPVTSEPEAYSLAEPSGLTVHGDRLYVADSKNHRIVIFGLDGTFQSMFGKFGPNPGQFNEPYGVTFGPDGKLYVCDVANRRVQRFTLSATPGELPTVDEEWATSTDLGKARFGGFTKMTLAPDGTAYVFSVRHDVTIKDIHDIDIHYIDALYRFAPDGSFLNHWGPPGAGEGEFNADDNDDDGGIALDADGLVYVTDEANNRVQVFDTDDAFYRQYGSFGDSDERFETPGDVALSPDGLLYVADTGNSRLKLYNPDGSLNDIWDAYGLGLVEFTPRAVALDGEGSLYVLDSSLLATQVHILSDDGSWQQTWGPFFDPDLLRNASGIAVGNGSIYVADTGLDAVRRFDSSGIIQEWEATCDLANTTFDAPQDVAVDPQGNLWVSDNQRLQKFTADGDLLLSIENPNNQSIQPHGLGLDSLGNLLVSDHLTSTQPDDRLLCFSASGLLQGACGTSSSGGTLPDTFNNPLGIAVDKTGRVFVADTDNHRIQILAPVTAIAPVVGLMLAE